MAERNPPLYLQAGSHPAEHDRRFHHAITAGSSGVFADGDFAVTQNGTPNMSVNVAAGRAMILGSESSLQGSYFVENDATVNLVIAAADGTNDRLDIVVAEVLDSEYSGSDDEWQLRVITGTPSGSPVAPSAPDNSIMLAMILVPALDTSITNAQITDLRTRTSLFGGLTVANNALQLPTSPIEGQHVWRSDLNYEVVWTGSVWQPVNVTLLAVGTALTISTTYQPVTNASLTLPAGIWVVEARVTWLVSTASPRSYSARIRNTTSSTTVDEGSAGAPATVDTRPTVNLLGTAVLGSTATVRLEGSVDAVDGVQSLAYAKIWARPTTVI